MDTSHRSTPTRTASWAGLSSHALRTAAALAAAALLATGLALVPIPGPAWATEYPGQQEVADARAAVENASATVDQLDAAIGSLEAAYQEADIAARIAEEDYVEAADASHRSANYLTVAEQRADEADAALDRARSELAHVAMATYRTGGSMGQLEALVVADGFDDVIARNEVLGRAASESDKTVQTVAAAELVATTMRDYAEQAAVDAEEAQQAALQAFEDANQAAMDAEQTLREVESTREAATVRLAELRGVSVELERQRQEGLAEQRRASEREEHQRVQREAEENNRAGNDSREPEAPANNPAPNSPAPNSPAPSNPGSGSNGGNDSPPPSSSNPPAAPNPPPASAPAPAPAPAPEPPATPPPPPAQTSGWKSTAAQGQSAVAHARTLIGSPYLLGGNGPAYDCSGLTQASWSTAGVYIPRTSRTQYEGTTKVAFSNLRQGDLLFWGTDRDPSKIYHVAIYAGNGMVIEAARPGVDARIRPYDDWGLNNLLPLAGRP